MKDAHDIPIRVFNKNQEQKTLQIHHICLIDSDHDYIIDKTVCIDKIESEININVEHDKE